MIRARRDPPAALEGIDQRGIRGGLGRKLRLFGEPRWRGVPGGRPCPVGYGRGAPTRAPECALGGMRTFRPRARCEVHAPTGRGPGDSPEHPRACGHQQDQAVPALDRRAVAFGRARRGTSRLSTSLVPLARRFFFSCSQLHRAGSTTVDSKLARKRCLGSCRRAAHNRARQNRRFFDVAHRVVYHAFDVGELSTT